MAKIDSLDKLRALYPPPKGLAVEKELTRLEKHTTRFIGLSPFFLLATSGGDGKVDVSPRGERPGFVHVLDEQTIVIPDRKGNSRVDSLRNVLENPEVGLLFLVPGMEESLRVNGTAEIRDDPELLSRFVEQDKAPTTVLVVKTREVFFQCGKAMLRSEIWEGTHKIDRSEFPSISQIIHDQIGSREPAPDHETVLKDYLKKLY